MNALPIADHALSILTRERNEEADAFTSFQLQAEPGPGKFLPT